MATILIPLPDHDFDRTETGVPWRTLRQRSHQVVFATPNSKVARADPRMITGEGLGIFAGLMKADTNGRLAYEDMTRLALWHSLQKRPARNVAEAHLSGPKAARGKHNPTATLGFDPVRANASQTKALREAVASLSPAARAELYN